MTLLLTLLLFSLLKELAQTRKVVWDCRGKSNNRLRIFSELASFSWYFLRDLVKIAMKWHQLFDAMHVNPVVDPLDHIEAFRLEADSVAILRELQHQYGI